VGGNINDRHRRYPQPFTSCCGSLFHIYGVSQSISPPLNGLP